MALLSTMTSFVSTTVNNYMTFPWAMLLNGAFAGIAYYGLRIILLTVCLKLLLSPLDLFQRYKMRKNQLISVRVKPQMEKLEKAYGSNPKVLQQKQAELNRREGMSYMSSCLPMIVTMVVFIWLWQSLLGTANFKQFENYARIYDIYEDAYVVAFDKYYDADNDTLAASYGENFRVEYGDAFLANYDADDIGGTAEKALAAAKPAIEQTAYADLYVATYSDWYVEAFAKNADTAYADGYGSKMATNIVISYCETIAQNDVFDYYEGIGEYADGNGYKHDSFLWVHDIWSPDVPWTNSLKKTNAEFKSAIGNYATDPKKSGIGQDKLDKMVDSYETVMARVINESTEGANGYLILPVLAVALNILMQIITRRQQKKSGQDQAAGQNAGCMKAMVFIMPIIMGIFALMYCAAFTLYMVTNSAMSLLINLVTTQISKKMVPIDGEKKIKAGKEDKESKTDKDKKSKVSDVERYGRPDPNSKKDSDKK